MTVVSTPAGEAGQDILQRTGEHKASKEQSEALMERNPAKAGDSAQAKLTVLDKQQGEYREESFSIKYNKDGKVGVERNGKQVATESIYFYADGKLYSADGALIGDFGIEKEYRTQLKTDEIIQANGTLSLNKKGVQQYRVYSKYSLTLDEQPGIIINRPPPGTEKVYERKESRLMQDSKDGGLAYGTERPSSFSVRWVPEKESQKYFRGAAEYTQEMLSEIYKAREKAGDVAPDKSIEVQKGVRAYPSKDGFQIRFTTNIPTTLLDEEGLTQAPGRIVSEYSKFKPEPPAPQKQDTPTKAEKSNPPPSVAPQAKPDSASKKENSQPSPAAAVPPPPPPLSDPKKMEPVPELSIPFDFKPADKPAPSAPALEPPLAKPPVSPALTLPPAPKPPAVAAPETPKASGQELSSKWKEIPLRYDWMGSYKQAPNIPSDGFLDLKQSGAIFKEEDKTRTLQRCKEAFEEGDLKDMKVGLWYRRSQNLSHHLMLLKADENTYVMDVVSGGLCTRPDIDTKNKTMRIFFRKEAGSDSWSVLVQKEKGKGVFESLSTDKFDTEGVLSARLSLAKDKGTPLEEFHPEMRWGPTLGEPIKMYKTSDLPSEPPDGKESITLSRPLTHVEMSTIRDKIVELVSTSGEPTVGEKKDGSGNLTEVTIDLVVKSDGKFGPRSSYSYIGGDKYARVVLDNKHGAFIWNEQGFLYVWQKSEGYWKCLGNSLVKSSAGKTVHPWMMTQDAGYNKLSLTLESFFEPYETPVKDKK